MSPQLSYNIHTELGLDKLCGKQCPYLKEGNQIKRLNQTWKIYETLNCNTNNIVYIIECNKTNSNKQYIGKTNSSLKVRISEHLGYVNTNKTEQATGEHITSRAHTLSIITETVIEK